MKSNKNFVQSFLLGFAICFGLVLRFQASQLVFFRQTRVWPYEVVVGSHSVNDCLFGVFIV